MNPLRHRWSAAFASFAALVLLLAARPLGQGRGIQADEVHPVLAIGAPAPDFNLPGVDGKMHTLAEYASANLLAVVFECNHCPTSQLYEGRIRALAEDYRTKGVTLIAINPNNPNSVRLNELGYTDLMDSLAEMKVRSAYRHMTWPYLYDGATQAVSAKFGVVATPHIYIFDHDRKLRYQGRIDDNQREDLVKKRDAREALDALLAGKAVPAPTTRAFGCSTKWMEKSDDVRDEMTKINAEPVGLDVVSAGGPRKDPIGRHGRRQSARAERVVDEMRRVRRRVPRFRNDLPDVPSARVRLRHGVDRRAGVESRNAGVSPGRTRIRSQHAARIASRWDLGAEGPRRRLEGRPAVCGRLRAQRQGRLSEGRAFGHRRRAPHRPGEHA